MRMLYRAAGAAALLCFFAVRGAAGCDLCAVYSSMLAKESGPGFFTGLYTQYTPFGTLQEEGDEVDNSADQFLDSSITQAIVGYQPTSRLSLQANIPWIDRSFRRVEGGVRERGSESGLGDVTLLATWRARTGFARDTLFAWNLYGGIKLATGDSDRLREELEEDHGHGEEGEEAEEHEHGEELASGVHGHDLALGSGSTDFVVGTSGAYHHRKLYANANVQYALRQEGDFDFRYANDLTWSLAGGLFVDLTHAHTVTVGLGLFGETKGEDELAGQRLDDTAITALYGGPVVTWSHGTTLYADLALDLPLRQDNTGLQVVPDGRLRLGLTWRP